jgi:uroporphyrinogen-III synthase
MSRPRVALTQSAGRLEDLSSLLHEQGFEVVRSPLLETVFRSDPRTRHLAAMLVSLPWLLITSRSTVEALLQLGVDLADAAERPRLAAVGPATARAIESAGGRVSLIGVPHDAEGLAHAFLAHPDASGPVGLPRGNRALDTLERILGQTGVATVPLVVYDTVQRPWNGDCADAVVLASPSAVEALPEEVARGARLVTLGARTSEAAHARGWPCQEAREPTAEAVLAALERVLS